MMQLQYEANWREKITSDFFVRTSQLLPRSNAATSESICIPIATSPNETATYAVYCGSSEEFYIRPLNPCIDDVDVLLYNAFELAVIEDFPVLPNDVSRLADTIWCYKIEQYLNYPGFVRLRVLGIMCYNWKYKKYEFVDTSLPRSYFKFDITNFAANFVEYDHHGFSQSSNIVRGPSIRCKTDTRRRHSKQDTVFSVWCPQWPKEAENWPKRLRYYRWPTIDTISEVVQRGCHVVYAQHRACRSDDGQWRLSFSVSEVILLPSWTPIQQIVYHLLRYVAKKELIQKDCPKEDEVLCSYHLKTLMLWTCEEKSPEWWNSCSLNALCCQIGLLLKLSTWVKKRHFPNYFIPEANLFCAPSNATVLSEIERKLNELRNSVILCHWFLENYILAITGKLESTINWKPHFVDYTLHHTENRKVQKAISIECVFKLSLTHYNSSIRYMMKSEPRIASRYILSWNCLAREFDLLTYDTKCLHVEKPIPATIWCFTYFDTALYSLNVSISLWFGEMAMDSELFFEIVKGMHLKPKLVRCHYHKYLLAQDLMENLTGLTSPSEFQLLSLLLKGFLRQALECDDSQSKIIATAALVYVAALHVATSEYQIAIGLCSAVLLDQTTHIENETLNAGCLFFIDDVVRIVGFCLLWKKFTEYTNFGKRQIYLDLRVTPEVFARHLTVISTERIFKQLQLNPDMPSSSLPFDQLLLVLTKRKFCILTKSIISFNAKRKRVYRRTSSVTEYATLNVDPLIVKEKIIKALMEFALENMTSFYNEIREDCGSQYYTVQCYRALYLYKCGQYDKVVDLCDIILHEPDLQDDLKEFAFANVLLLPPLDSFFDGDVQSLLGLHTLFYYLSPLNDEMLKFKVTPNSTFEHVFAACVYSGKYLISYSLVHAYSAKCHYFLGRHFLARYLKLRCCIDCDYSFTEAITEFASVKSNFPFEHIIRRFLLQKLRKIQNNAGVLS